MVLHCNRLQQIMKVEAFAQKSSRISHNFHCAPQHTQHFPINLLSTKHKDWLIISPCLIWNKGCDYLARPHSTQSFALPPSPALNCALWNLLERNVAPFYCAASLQSIAIKFFLPDNSLHLHYKRSSTAFALANQGSQKSAIEYDGWFRIEPAWTSKERGENCWRSFVTGTASPLWAWCLS